MLIKYGKGTKKFRFPVDLHLKQAVGALTLHTGGRNYIMGYGHKKCPQRIIGEPTRLFQMEIATKMVNLF